MATTVTLKPNAIDLSGSTSGTTTLQATAVAGATTITLPAATDTLVGKATTDTLTNKTLTSPVITTPTISSLSSASATALTLQSAGTTAITVDTSQNMGIGTASPVAKLQVKGSGTSGQVTSSFILENSSSGTAGMDITGTAGSSYLRVLYGGGAGTGTNSLTETMRIGLEGASVGVQQIKFAATQVASSDANTLDDYEEGTWTPTVQGSSTGGTGTYTTQQGTYTKIGNIVKFQAEIVWTAHTGSGQLEVGNYPFTSTAQTSPISLSFYGGPTFVLGNFIQAYKNPSNTTSGTAQTSSASAFSSVALSGAGTLQVNGVYKVA